MDGDTFHKNVIFLTQIVPPSKEFLKHFKEGMFEKPNTRGFQHATHYLLTFYDPERARKRLQWPLLCKQSESKYRSDVKDFLTAIAQENPDVNFPQILATHLLHASGNKFNNIMANLSTVVLRKWIKNEGESVWDVPKAKVAPDLVRTMLNNRISQNAEIVEEGTSALSKNVEAAKKYANELVQSIREGSDELLRKKEYLIKLSSEAPVHPDLKDRLINLNDNEIVPMWNLSLDKNIELLKKNQLSLKTLSELSTNVANMVESIVSNDTNTLDGKQLPVIHIDQLSEINELSPETQVMLFRVYENETLNFKNFLSLLELMLMDLRRFIEKHGFPDLSVCASQVSASCEDAKLMRNLFHALEDRIVELASHLKTTRGQKADFSINQNQYNNRDNDLFDSELLKSSPTININLNPQSNGNEFYERLELTPVEPINRTLFSRHRRTEDGKIQAANLRPTILFSRMNLDAGRCSYISGKSSPLSRNVSSRTIDRWNADRGGAYSRLFSSLKKLPKSQSIYSVRAGANSLGPNSMTDMNSTCEVYSASELRAYLAVTKSPAESTAICSPKKFTPTKNDRNDRASSTIIEDEKSPKSTEFSELIGVDKEKNNIELARSPDVKTQKKAQKPVNKRLSISDLLERYRKVCDKSVDVTIGMNLSADEDESD